MALLPDVFNPSAPGQEGVGDFTAIDPGTYKAHIIDSKMKDTQAGDGAFLELTWEVLEGECAGRRVWTRLNLKNPSEQAVEIAQKHLTSICLACGIQGSISDSAVLHSIPIMLRVIKKKSNSNYPEGNETKGYEPIGGAGAPSPAAAAIAGVSSPFPTPAAAPVAAAPVVVPVAAPAADVANPTQLPLQVEAAPATVVPATPVADPAVSAPVKEEAPTTTPPWLKK